MIHFEDWFVSGPFEAELCTYFSERLRRQRTETDTLWIGFNVVEPVVKRPTHR